MFFTLVVSSIEPSVLSSEVQKQQRERLTGRDGNAAVSGLFRFVAFTALLVGKLKSANAIMKWLWVFTMMVLFKISQESKCAFP